MPLTRDCDFCGKPYSRSRALIGRYCSPRCGYDARRQTTPASYRMLYLPDHPLRGGRSPYVPEHRVTLWNSIGPGTHACHHCGTQVRWAPGQGARGDALVVDHFDRNIRNNALANLVPSCVTCNIRNTDRVVIELTEPHVKRPNGTKLRGVERACEQCGGTFVAVPDPRPNRGRFCSRSCARITSSDA